MEILVKDNKIDEVTHTLIINLMHVSYFDPTQGELWMVGLKGCIFVAADDRERVAKKIKEYLINNAPH